MLEFDVRETVRVIESAVREDVAEGSLLAQIAGAEPAWLRC